MIAIASPAIADLAYAPSGLDFGDVSAGTTSEPRSAVLRIVDTFHELDLKFELTGDSSFEADTSGCPSSLSITPGPASCEVVVTFVPRKLGPAMASLVVTSQTPSGTTATLSLVGNGTEGILFDPSRIHLDADIGSTSASQGVVLQLLGEVEATGLTFSASSGLFQADTTDCGNSLSDNGTCGVRVTFSPLESGLAESTLTVTSDQGYHSDLFINGCGFAEDTQSSGYETVLISRPSGCKHAKGNENSKRGLAISGDGRYVAFASIATNLDPADADEGEDVFVRDMKTLTTVLASRASGFTGAKGNGISYSPTISEDGRFVAFLSTSTNLTPDDADALVDIFVRDLHSGDTFLASRASGINGVKSDRGAGPPSISGDGRFVAFTSGSTNLDPDDTDTVVDVFVRDLMTYTTILVSRADGINGAKANLGSNFPPSISSDGLRVAFSSQATNLHPDDIDNMEDIFVRDLVSHETILVSRATGPSGDKADGGSSRLWISGDGNRVAFRSNAMNLDPDDPDSTPDVFVRDLLTNETMLISRASGTDGVKGNSASIIPQISRNGRFVVYQSNSTNLDPDDSDGGSEGTDIYARDLEARQTILVSRAGAFDGEDANGHSEFPAVSSSGRFVAFDSQATNMHPDDVDDFQDVYRRDVLGPSTEGALGFEPPSVDVGEVGVGSTSSPATVTLRNLGGVAVTGLVYDNPGSGVEMDASACGSGLLPGEACAIILRSAPPSMGMFRSVLSVASDQASAAMTVTGLGTAAALTAAPAQLDFGSVPPGITAAPESVVLISTGNEVVEVTNVSSPSLPFTLAGGTCPALPFSLAPGSSCYFNFAFAPVVEGTYAQTITVEDTADPVSFTLIGEGVPAPSQIAVSPEELSLSVATGGIRVLPLTVSNSGGGVLDWAVTQDAGGQVLRSANRANAAGSRAIPEIARGLIRAKATEGGGGTVAHGFPVILGDEVVLSHSASLDIQAPNTPACGVEGTNTTSANQFLRTFALPDFGISSDLDVNEVTFGVEALSDVPSASISVNLYTLDGDFVYGNLTPIGSAVEELSPQQQTLVTVPVTGTAPAGSTLVVEIAAPDLSNLGAFFAGSNGLGETAPSYIATAGCDLPEPVAYADLGLDNVHLVMTVSGTAEPPLDCSLPDWVDVNPMAGSLTGGSEQALDVTFDASALAPGGYTANLCLASNDPDRPVVTVPLTLAVTDASAELAFDPTSLDFGEVDVGETSAPLSATLRNDGDADATALTFDLSGGGFSADTSACGDTLPAGSACAIAITFEPVKSGPATAQLHVASAEGAMADLALVGTGITVADVDVGVTINATRDYFRPGQMADYLVTLYNAGSDAASDAHITSLLSPALDLGFASWLCVGPASSGCTSSGQGDLDDTGLAVPAGGSVTYLLSAPVRWDAQGPAETSAAAGHSGDSNPANDTALAITPIALYRDGFELYGGIASLQLQPGETFAPTDMLTLQWPVVGDEGRVETILAATLIETTAAKPVFRVERFMAGSLGWVRLVALDARDAETASPWLPVTWGTPATLAFLDAAHEDDADDESGDVRIVILFTADGELQLPLATRPDAYRLWSGVPVSVMSQADSH